jgi:hypothetical protein|nr:hypothetical protein [uncultured Psychroserpens sp.]
MKLVWRLTTIDKAFFIIFGVALIASFFTWVFEERFDEKIWHSNPSRRYKMADDIIDSEIFIGMTRSEIVDILGEPVDPLNNVLSLLNYKIGTPPSFSEILREELIINFVNDKAVNVFRVRIEE